MKMNVSFQESKQSFNPQFGESSQTFAADMGEVIDLSSDEKERVYQEAYETGTTDGYTKGHTDGMEYGKAQGYNDGMDAVVMQTVVSYSNDIVTKALPVACFAGCTTLESISLPKITHVNGFHNCTALKNVDLPGALYLQSSAFKNCVSLERLDFPLAEQIHTGTFQGCASLVSLILRKAKVASLGNVSSFTDTPIANGTGFIYVPDELVNSYKAATNWSTYADQIKPISELEGET